jgi:hypothetical protein
MNVIKTPTCSRLSAVDADGYQVSRPLRGLQLLHSDCLRAPHDVGGDLACYNLDVDGEMVVMGSVARIWEEDDSVLSTDYSCSTERSTTSPSKAAPVGLTCARGENSKQGRKFWPKVNEGLTTKAC